MKANPNRRTFLKGTGAALGVGATVGTADRLGFSPVGTASAVAPLVPVGIALGGAALGYLVNEGVDYLTGDSRDYSGYTGADALHTQIITGVTEMGAADETTMTAIRNNIESSDNVALAKGKTAAVKAMNNTATQSEATTAMQEAIDGYYSIIQENILNHYHLQIGQIRHHIEQVAAHSNIGVGAVFEYRDNLNNVWSSTIDSPPVNNTSTYTVTLLDGRTPEFEGYELNNNGAGSLKWRPKSSAQIRYKTPDGSGPIPYSFSNVLQAYDQLSTARDRVNSNLSTFISDLYSAYEPGEIPLEQVLDPLTLYDQMSTDYDTTGYHGYAAASAAILGIPSSQGNEMFLYLEDSQVEVEATLYTQHSPTDADGNAVGFKTGQTYDPTTWDSPAFMAYQGVFEDENGEVSEETDFVKLDQAFTIRQMSDKDGNEVETTNLQSDNYQTSEITKLREELEQLYQVQKEMQEEAEKETSGGGGGFDLGGDNTPLILVGAGALVALLFGGSR